MLAGYLTVLAVAASAAGVRWWLGESPASQLVAGACAGLFPGAALQYGEIGVAWAMAISLLLVAIHAVLFVAGRHVLARIGALVLLVLGASSTCAFLVLVHALGSRMAVLAILLVLVAFVGVPRILPVADRLPGGRPVLGAAASVLATALLAQVLGMPLGPVPSLLVGGAVAAATLLAVSVAAAVGRVANAGGAAVVPDLLEAVLATVGAVPVFFYGLTLYLR